MRKFLHVFPLLAVVVVVLGGCAKDEKRKVIVKYQDPVLMAIADVRASTGVTTAPKEIGRPGKIYVKGSFIFVSEPGEGIHIIDNSNPFAPNKIAFVRILGNADMAVQGNILYADSFRDLLVFDISNPTQVRKVKTVEDALGYSWDKERRLIGYIFDNKRDSIVVGYRIREVVSYEHVSKDLVMYNSAIPLALTAEAGGASNGKGGSMARFTISKDHLYAVDMQSLRSFNIQQPTVPVAADVAQIGRNIETVFPYGDNLFIGSSDAMYIYSLANPAKPERKSAVTHFRACDPVVVENNLAYVTIRSGTICGGNFNQLLVYDVKNISAPVKIATYDMKHPFGLGIDKGRLFICEGEHGLRFLNAASATDIQTVKMETGIDAYDVIPYAGADRLLVSAKDGLYQYSYTSMSSPLLLSKIATQRTVAKR